ncbi:Glutamate receptor, ionotropic kainate 2 [Melipona quadrifasciata]|uniref:Glutamate receptor, ionotropic kainate 2 n=1 Tax=Melipona quadrifasciata TaxID=166423 RepID=A0A0M8ZY90_9HYME|nr:Glutamate receptor, ionotropic kainate 2 [Melipona quadrifasciata]
MPSTNHSKRRLPAVDRSQSIRASCLRFERHRSWLTWSLNSTQADRNNFLQLRQDNCSAILRSLLRASCFKHQTPESFYRRHGVWNYLLPIGCEAIGKSNDLYPRFVAACQQVKYGVQAVFGPSDPILGQHIHSICDALDIPHLEARLDLDTEAKEFSINLYPAQSLLNAAYQDIMEFLNWTKVAIIYEDDYAEGKPERFLGSPSVGFGKLRVQGGARRAGYPLPSWMISLALVCLEQSPAMWAGLSGDTDSTVFNATFVSDIEIKESRDWRRPAIRCHNVTKDRVVPRYLRKTRGLKTGRNNPEQAASGCAPSVEVLPISDVNKAECGNTAKMHAPTSLAGSYDTSVWGLVKLRELVRSPKSREIEVNLRQADPDSYRQVLSEMKSKEIRNLIVDTRPEHMHHFLRMILQLQMNDYKYHYLFTTFDIETFDLEDFKYNFVNITAFRLVDAEDVGVRGILRDMERYQPNNQSTTKINNPPNDITISIRDLFKKLPNLISRTTPQPLSYDFVFSTVCEIVSSSTIDLKFSIKTEKPTSQIIETLRPWRNLMREAWWPAENNSREVATLETVAHGILPLLSSATFQPANESPNSMEVYAVGYTASRERCE